MQRRRRFSEYKNWSLLLSGLLLLFVLVGCTGESERGAAEPAGSDAQMSAAERPRMVLASAEWSSARASAHVVKAVLEEELGYRVEIRTFPAQEMWRAVAEGRADATVSAWLPLTHGQYADRYGDAVVDLGANLDGVRTGLVVPKVSVGRQTGPTGERVEPYIPVSSIPELAEYADRFNGRIIGIEAGAGVMERTREALEVYGLDERFRLVEGSEARMVNALEEAIQSQSWIVVTGWTPHWAFGQWELAFLEDPENVYGSGEKIHTLVRPGFPEAHPDAAAVLDRFHWSLDEIGRVMLWIERDDGVDPYGQALRWVETHQDMVETWLPELEAE